MIIPMKKVTVVALKKDREALMLALQKCGEMMIVANDEENPTTREGEQISLKLQKTSEVIKELKPFEEKAPFLADKPEVDYEEFLKDNNEAIELSREVSECKTQQSALESAVDSLDTQISQFEPWIDLDTPIDKLCSTKHMRLFTGFIPLNSMDDVLAVSDEFDSEVQVLGPSKEGKAAVFYCLLDQSDDFISKVKEAGFIEASVPQKTGYVRDILTELKENKQNAENELAKITDRLKKLGKESDKVKMLFDQQNSALDRANSPSVDTESAFILIGWCRSDRTDKLEKAVKDVSDYCFIEFEDPAEEDNPPTQVQNNRFINAFEGITDMFSRPNKSEVDPNPVMGPWYWLIFGLMMGDAGYGLLMVLGIFLFKKLKKPSKGLSKLLNMFYYCGFTSAFWGVLFGSYFGATWHPILFEPMQEPVKMLIFCMVIGVLHIFTGMATKAYMLIRDGHVADAIFDQFSWMVLITGIGLFFIPALKTVGMIMAIIGAAVVVFTAGRAKPNVFGKITGGLLGLYDVTSYMSDILSYSRILALSLSTAVIGMVMNMLAGMVQGSVFGFICSIFIYIIGHVFNIVMGLLSAYVHSSRLQYIEFFGKFYEGGGYEFKPLSVDTKYVDVK